MKKRIITIVLVLFMLFLSGCDLFNKENGPTEPVDSLYEVYKLAAANGYEGTYEEWIESIRGENGKSIELVVDNNYLCYKYTGENILIPIYDLSKLMGEPGEQGAAGINGVDGVSITKVEKTATDGLVDTYTITFSNGTTTTYTVNNGSTGSQGEKGDTGVSIVKVEKTATDGLVDTYTITFSNGTTTTYTVNNGSAGSQGEKGEQGEKGDAGAKGDTGNGISKIEYTRTINDLIDVYTIYYTDGTTFEFNINHSLSYDERKDMVFDVTYDSNGGSEIAATQVLFGSKLDKPTDPTKDGYVLDGWYVGDEKWSFNGSIVTSDLTLKAKWNLETFKVSYSEDLEDTEYTILDEDITLPIPQKSGYTFSGWYDNEELTGDAIDKIEQGSFGNKELFAKWTLNTHSITFRSNGGTEYENLSFDYMGEVNLPTPERSGYRFLFWSDDANMLNAYDGKFDEDTDLILYARWLVDGMSTYTVETYLQNADGTYSVKPYEVLTYEAAAETVVTASSKFYDGYTAPNTMPSGLVVGDNSLKLKVFYTVRTYTLNVNGKSYNYKFGEAIEPIDNPVREGYTFTGWSTEIPETMPKQNLTITATWQANVYKLTFDTNGSDEAIDSMNVIYNQSLNLPIPTISGYEFIGWYYNNQKIEDKWLLDTDATLKAHWATKYADFTFSLVDDTYEVSSYVGTSKEVVIPNTVDGVAVTSIANEVFKDNSTIESLTLPNGIVKVGDHAFMNMSALEELVLPSAISTFGEYVLKDTNIDNITMYAGSTMLLGLYDYEESNIPDDITITLKYDNNAYVNPATGVLKNINNKNYNVALNESFTSVPNSSFYNLKGLKSITIPNSVTSISNSAFSGCTSLTSITIPDSVTSIGSYAFSTCSSLTSITIPDSVTSIGSYAFSGCSSLTSLTIPDSVTSISTSAFSGCRSLTSIIIPDSVTSIGDYAFQDCYSLASIIIPDGVTSIGYSAFYYCSSLANTFYSGNKAQWMNININANNEYLVNSNIEFNSEVTKLEYIETSDFTYTLTNTNEIFNLKCINKNITAYDFSGFEGYTIKNIGDSAFYQCSSLTSITIPDSVTSIGSNAFDSCTSLASLTIPDSVTSISNSAFSGCRSLTSITIPDGVTSIGDYTFYNCSSLASIIIPDSVTSIGNHAFYNCSSLTSITIPDGVTSIGSSAFNGCSSLTSITIPDGITSIGIYTFYSCSRLKTIIMPKSVVNVDDYAFYSNYTSMIDVFYNGSEDEFSSINIGGYNNMLLNANIHYDCDFGNFTISFDSNGGTSVNDAIIKFGDKLTLPDNPTKEGYKFNSWYIDEELTTKYSSSYMFTASTTLYAKWDKQVNVTFVTNGGNSIDPLVVYEGEAIGNITALREGYRFAGWFLNEELTEAFDMNTKLSDDITLYAKWDPTITVTYNANGGSVGAFASIYEAREEMLADYNAFAGTNYTFETLAATGNWSPINFHTFYYSNGMEAKWSWFLEYCQSNEVGINSKNVANSLLNGGEIPEDSLAYAAMYIFKAFICGTKMRAGNSTYETIDWTNSANYDAIWNAYLATVPTSSNSGVNDTFVFSYFKEISVLPTPVREGYSFVGWKDANGNTVTSIPKPTEPTTITLTAEWIQKQ